MGNIMMMQKWHLTIVAAAVMGLSGTVAAEAVAPGAGVSTESKIDLLVIPTAVTCELGVDNSSAHGSNDGSALVWNVGLTEQAGATQADKKTSITDALAKLRRTVMVGFKNPSVEGGDVTNKDLDCSLASNRIAISMRANSLDADGGAYPGKILSSDGQTWFNYGVAVNETDFKNVAETTAGGANKVAVQFPTRSQSINGDTTLALDGGQDATVVIEKVKDNKDPTFQLGQYPFDVYLKKDYSGISAPTVHKSNNSTSEDAGVGQYRSHFTVTASYN